MEYPELELRTNIAENSMCPVALSRKNWIHIGCPQPGPKVAAIHSVVESCRRLKISVADYLPRFSPHSLIARSGASQPPAAWVFCVCSGKNSSTPIRKHPIP